MQIRELRRNMLRNMARRVLSWEEEFRAYVRVVCESGLVKELYLIGSRARGEHATSSDFDLLAVVEEGADPLEVAERLRLLRRGSFPLDLIVLREGEVRDPVYREMLEGRRRLCQ